MGIFFKRIHILTDSSSKNRVSVSLSRVSAPISCQKSLPYRLFKKYPTDGRANYYRLFVKCRIEGVEILCVQAVGGEPERFTEMTHLNKAAETPFPPRFQAFAYRKKADRIFFESGLLFCVFQSLIEVNAR